MALDPGTRFGRYVIERIVGEGGMGTVYAARDPSLGRRVAIKMLRGGRVAEPNFRERLLREARAGAALSHPNATTVYEVGEHDGHPYIAMEYLEGKTLREHVGDPKIDIETRLRWLEDVARVLGAAHAAGLVHRDIKPENVIVTPGGVVKVLDFGIARALGGFVDASAATLAAGDEPPRPETITTEGVMVGTPLYMAPEQMLGNPVDGRTDQFAWGVTAFELLSGRVPWHTGTSPSGGARIVALVVSDQPAPKLEVAGVSRQTREAVARALEKNPQRRFASMIDLLAALCTKTATTQRSVAPRPTSTRRAALVVSAIALAGVTAFIARRPREQSPAVLAADGASASASASARPTAITDLPLPPTTNPEALAGYKAFLQSSRDGAAEKVRLLQRAAQLDPTMAAAHLRLASLFVIGTSLSRESFRRASQHRATLDERDAAFLDAIEPAVARVPADPAEWERRVTALVDRWPLDVELIAHLVLVNWVRGRFAETEVLSARAAAADPRDASVWNQRAVSRAYGGDFAGARAAVEECLRMSPGATSCALGGIQIETDVGDCERVETYAKRIATGEPQEAYGYSAYARAMAARGRPNDTVLETLKQAWARESASTRLRVETNDRLRLAMLAGRFDEALQIANEHERALADVVDEAEHAALARAVIEIQTELGRPTNAARAAADFLVRRGAWSPAVFMEDFAFAKDGVGRALAAELHAGVISKAAFDVKRGAWLAEWDAKLEGVYRGMLWVHGYADLAETRAEAEEALAAMPQFPAVTSHRPLTIADAHIGRVHFLVGHFAEAEKLLTHATASCRTLDEAVEHTRAHWFLGQAREALGDKAGACAAYRVVLDRWGSAKKSVTADKARARVRALACGA